MRTSIILIHLIIIFSSVQVSAQVKDVESLMTRRYLSPADVAYNASFLIPEYHAKGQKDTLQAIMDFWEERCGIPEPLVRCRILFAIEDGSFSTEMYNDFDIIEMLREYQNVNTVYDFQIALRRYRYGYTYETVYDKRLNEFTSRLAEQLLAEEERPAEETFLLRAYANQCADILAALETEAYGGTEIRALYLRQKEQNEPSTYFHNDWMPGIWIPHGNLDILGLHPSIGYRCGVKYKKLIADLSIGLKFVNAPHTYQVYKNGMMWDTKEFFGGYVGLDANFEMFRVKQNSLELAGGVAYDGFDCLSIEDDIYENDRLTKSIGSLNLNIGLAYKFHFKNKRYLGIEFKYNFVNYRNPVGTNLDGNVYTVNLLIGNIIGRSIYRYMY